MSGDFYYFAERMQFWYYEGNINSPKGYSEALPTHAKIMFGLTR